jgi:hypothetical protein
MITKKISKIVKKRKKGKGKGKVRKTIVNTYGGQLSGGWRRKKRIWWESLPTYLP